MEALAATTHMGIGAHQDDLEIMASANAEECYRQPEKGFTGVTVTNGAGSPRAGPYIDTTDDQMVVYRRREQRAAAQVGEYMVMAQLDYPSKEVKSEGADEHVIQNLVRLLGAGRPGIVYTHNLADKHETHVGVAVTVIKALRDLRGVYTPDKLVGVEVWRGLDWMVDGEKYLIDTSQRPNLQAALLGGYDSQISGGKRYDLATVGRQLANATFFESHGVDLAPSLAFAMDMTPLIDPAADMVAFLMGTVDRAREQMREMLEKRLREVN